MDMNIPGAPQKRAFWSKPEGITGIATLLGLVAGGVVLINLFGPAILAALGLAIGILGKSLALGALGVVCFLSYLVVTNRKVHTLIEYFFKSAMRKVTGAFIEIDPIGIMRNFISDLEKRRGEMAENIKKLNGQLKAVELKINENKQNAEAALKLAVEAKNRGNVGLMTVQGKQSERLTDYTIKLEDVVAKMRILLKMLRKYYEASDTVIQDLSNEVNIQEDQRRMMFAAYGAMTAAREIIMGDGDKRELFDMAMETVKDQYGTKLGEIEDFMTVSQSFIDGMDLQNGVFAADALKKIEAWEAKVDSVLLGDDKRKILESSASTSIPMFNVSAPQGVDDYSKLFGKR